MKFFLNFAFSNYFFFIKHNDNLIYFYYKSYPQILSIYKLSGRIFVIRKQVTKFIFLGGESFDSL